MYTAGMMGNTEITDRRINRIHKQIWKNTFASVCSKININLKL